MSWKEKEAGVHFFLLKYKGQSDDSWPLKVKAELCGDREIFPANCLFNRKAEVK